MANVISHARQYRLAVEQVVDFSDLNVAPSAVTIKLPQGAIYLGGTLFVETAFDGTTPTLAIGVAGSTTSYLGATAIDATGATALTLNTGLKASGETIILTPNAGAIAATTGQVRIVMEYLIANRAQEVQP